MTALKILAGISIAIIAAWMLIYPTSSYRFQLTLSVDTPSGPKSGASVMEVTSYRYPAWMTFSYGAYSINNSFNGEAVLVDLGADAEGKQRNVIALLGHGPRADSTNFYWLPNRAFAVYLREQSRAQSEYKSNFDKLPRGQQFSEHLRRQAGARASSKSEGLSQRSGCLDNYCELANLPPGSKVELRGELAPTLATFADLKDAKTARVIQPDDFQQIFGAGFRLRSITLEIRPTGTWPLNIFGVGRDSLSHNIKARLPNIFAELENKDGTNSKNKDHYIARLDNLKVD